MCKKKKNKSSRNSVKKNLLFCTISSETFVCTLHCNPLTCPRYHWKILFSIFSSFHWHISEHASVNSESHMTQSIPHCCDIDHILKKKQQNAKHSIWIFIVDFACFSYHTVWIVLLNHLLEWTAFASNFSLSN